MIETTATLKITPVASTLTFNDRMDHFLARWGYRRESHLVEPGLYSLGKPTPESPVFVTANYTLSFDALRSNLGGIDCYILVLDTKGINVWCAAGKGTFGTDELIERIKVTGLENVVSHRKVILPQLGAPGVSAYSVKKWSGWQVEYGPVRAADIKEYIKTHQASKEMRTVRFSLIRPHHANTDGSGLRRALDYYCGYHFVFRHGPYVIAGCAHCRDRGYSAFPDATAIPPGERFQRERAVVGRYPGIAVRIHNVYQNGSDMG